MTMVVKSTSVQHANSYKYLVVRFVLSLALLQIHTVGILGQRNVIRSCTLANGRQGNCLELSQCRSAQVTRNNDPGSCNNWEGYAIVCCLPYRAPSYSVNDFSVTSDVRDYQDDLKVETNIENVFGDLYNEDSYEGTNRRQAQTGTQAWWLNQNRPFGPTTSTTTTRRPFGNRPTNNNRPSVNRPVTNRPTAETEEPEWGFEDDNRPSYARPTTSRQTTSRPTPRPSRPVYNRPTTSAPYRPTNRPATQQGRSISEQKCIEYSRSVSTSVGALPLLPNAEPVIISVAKCDYNSLPLIVGGTQTAPGEFPHMTAVGYRSNGKIDWDCGGSLISEFFVMTAGHCTTSQKGPPYMVRLGELDLKRDNDGADPKNYRVLHVIKHPEYKTPARYNDIALLRLVDKVTFTKFIRPACLYTKKTFDVDKVMATGWGKIDFAENPSDILLKVSLNIIDDELCKNRYESDKSSDRLREGIVPTMMCAGELKGGKDTCQGDSGGPIQITKRDNQCIFHIVGITSFGKFCAAENTPGVYTRVSSYIPWIESVVWPHDRT